MNVRPDPGPASRAIATAVHPAHAVAPSAPTLALEAIRAHEGDVLLDLDETLYLRNSTEDFIDTARPAHLAYALLRLLDLARPWRWTGAQTRDAWRMRLVLVLFPWTVFLWRLRAGRLARRFANAPLLEAAAGVPRERCVVATLGFGPAVRPLVAAMGLDGAAIVACRVWRLADRQDGKLALVERRLGAGRVRESLCVTDSPQDLPLLEACATPVFTVWSDARFRPAFAGLYVPGRYLSAVKRPGARYIRRGILQDDFVLWVLASVWLAASPALHVAGLACLLLSLWAIYETGYVENDRIGARHEEAPRLSETFGRVSVATPALAPWAWAAASGTAGIALMRWPQLPSPADALVWSVVLLSTALCFALFNRLDKRSRIWPYAGLQLSRCGAFLAIVPAVPVAAAFVGAHVIEKWVAYFVYRVTGSAWPDLPGHAMRLVFALLLVAVSTPYLGAGVLLEGPTLALMGFLAFKARREIRAAVHAARRIDRPGVAASGDAEAGKAGRPSSVRPGGDRHADGLAETANLAGGSASHDPAWRFGR